MLKRDVLIADDAPAAIGPYSLGIKTGDMVFISGTLGIEPNSGEMVSGGIAAETRQVLTNMARILEAGGSSLQNVVKTTVFMQDLADFSEMNAVYAEFFSNEPPARSTVQVAALPKGAAVEIEAIAVVGGYLGD
jgi:2-iminobutanoate/2-iminopropanoate deaminase